MMWLLSILERCYGRRHKASKPEATTPVDTEAAPLLDEAAITPSYGSDIPVPGSHPAPEVHVIVPHSPKPFDLGEDHMLCPVYDMKLECTPAQVYSRTSHINSTTVAKVFPHTDMNTMIPVAADTGPFRGSIFASYLRYLLAGTISSQVDATCTLPGIVEDLVEILPADSFSEDTAAPLPPSLKKRSAKKDQTNTLNPSADRNTLSLLSPEDRNTMLNQEDHLDAQVYPSRPPLKRSVTPVDATVRILHGIPSPPLTPDDPMMVPQISLEATIVSKLPASDMTPVSQSV
jgi:hypothetical protein